MGTHMTHHSGVFWVCLLAVLVGHSRSQASSQGSGRAHLHSHWRTVPVSDKVVIEAAAAGLQQFNARSNSSLYALQVQRIVWVTSTRLHDSSSTQSWHLLGCHAAKTMERPTHLQHVLLLESSNITHLGFFIIITGAPPTPTDSNFCGIRLPFIHTVTTAHNITQATFSPQSRNPMTAAALV